MVRDQCKIFTFEGSQVLFFKDAVMNNSVFEPSLNIRVYIQSSACSEYKLVFKDSDSEIFINCIDKLTPDLALKLVSCVELAITSCTNVADGEMLEKHLVDALYK